MGKKFLMAFATGKASTEVVEYKKYVGIAPVKVLAVNPTQKELSEIYGRDMKDPEYITEKDGIKSIRVDFIVKKEKSETEEIISKISFFIRDAYRTNKDNTKVQVIDKYGRTAWVTQEQFKNKEIPVYSNGPAKLSKDYEACYIGQENLIQFLIKYLGIPATYNVVNGQFIDKTEEELKECEAKLVHIAEYFKGDVRELKEILNFQPNNKVKVLFGIKQSNGREYQTINTDFFMYNGTTKYSTVAKMLSKRYDEGGYPNETYKAEELSEYTVAPSDYSKEEPLANPFANTAPTADKPAANPFDKAIPSDKGEELPF